MSTRIEEYDYRLAPEMIAEVPCPQRDRSKLMVVDRCASRLRHHIFCELNGLLRAGDLLVVNDSRVFPARLRGRKETGGKVELLLERRISSSDGYEVWRSLARASRPLPAGTRILFEDGVEAEVLRESEGAGIELGIRSRISVDRFVDVRGEVPLPPYIKRNGGGADLDAMDRERYQTVFAHERGSVAAPTAGLHFTEALCESLDAMGVAIVPVTLHVGPGTFLPVRAGDYREHRMHGEWCRVDERAAVAIDQARREDRRIVAVGTTTVRAIESAVGGAGTVEPYEGWTELFITPGFTFRAVDGLITNFHLPRSTLLLMVSAFAGRERILDAYREASRRGYRFYSYGDAMLIL